MVRPFTMKMIREHLQAIADASHIVCVKFPLERILYLLDQPNFDEPSETDKYEAEIAATTKDAEPKFTFTAGWYMGEDWVEAKVECNHIEDGLGELSWAVEQATKKELDRRRIADERLADALEVASDEKYERQLERLRAEDQKEVG